MLDKTYHPQSEFELYFRIENYSENARIAIQKLSQHLDSMSYENARFNYSNDYTHVVDCICNATGSLGIDIADKLNTLCSSSKINISCVDVDFPDEIPVLGKKDDCFIIIPGFETTSFLLQDERYLVVIDDRRVSNNEIKVYFYKK